MATECIPDIFGFEGVEGRKVVAAFDGGAITSNAGALLLGATDRAIRMVDRLASCFVDRRSQAHVEHSVATLVGQRIFAIALGYEDLNDHETLRHDPLMAVLAGKLEARRADCAAVAGKSTLNRLELSKPEPSRYHKISYDAEAVDKLFVDLFLEAHRTAPSQITLDLDATDDPLHGEQEGRFFHGYYKSYCYLPLYIFCGRHLLCARLRRADIDASAGAIEEVARIVAQIRERWPEVRILLRADSGFTRDDLMTWCEQNDVDYLFGLAKNDRLIAEIAAELAEAAEENRISGKPARRFKDFRYRTRKSWSRQRRVVGKAEWMIPSTAESESDSTTKPRRNKKNKKSIKVGDIDLATLEGRANPRFVVTSLPAGRHQARALYEKLYCARGEMENRIKECQLDLFADRTSTGAMRANQLRLWLSSMAYVLISALRRIALATTRFADATCGTIRLKLLKIGAQVRISVRRIKFSMASAFPYTDVFRTARAALDSAAL
ncbi:IS1380 family transposase [Bradyrhizobium sp.]|uniref:IS1380 family transposase n=1 Tax=Bradyrhizobium sp. TaxID=376 RepID=UPI003C70FCBE